MAFCEKQLRVLLQGICPAAAAVVFENVGSTNIAARELAPKLAGNFLVAANSQSAGRGSHGRQFHSPEGGFYLTAALRDVPFSLPVTAAAGVAAAEALQQVCGRAVALKWVNDIRFGGKKAGGILCERTGDGAVLVGLGLNLQTPAGGFPKELAAIAGALDIDPACCNALAAAFYASLTALLQAPQSIVPRYSALCETLGQHVRFELGGKTLTGTALSVDGQTALTVKLDDGGSVVLQSGEASVRPYV